MRALPRRRVVTVRAAAVRPLEPPDAYGDVPRRVLGRDGCIRPWSRPAAGTNGAARMLAAPRSRGGFPGGRGCARGLFRVGLDPVEGWQSGARSGSGGVVAYITSQITSSSGPCQQANSRPRFTCFCNAGRRSQGGGRQAARRPRPQGGGRALREPVLPLIPAALQAHVREQADEQGVVARGPLISSQNTRCPRAGTPAGKGAAMWHARSRG